MHYFLSLSLEHFYAGVLRDSAETRSFPINSDQFRSNPLIIHHEKQVLDIDRKAAEAGAQIGIALSEAKALLPGATFLPWEEEHYREAQEEWLDICNQFSDVIEPDTQCSAYLDLTSHPDPLAIAWQLQKELKEDLGWESHIGIAGSKWIARVADMVGGEGVPYERASTDPASFLAPLKTKMLLPIPEEHRMRLRFLGYRTIGEVAGVPLNVLQEQFGREGLLIHQAARGGVFQPVRAVYPKDSVASRMYIEGGIDNTEAMIRVLQKVSENLSDQLQEREAQGNEITAIVEDENGAVRRLSRKFMKPMQEKRAIYAGLKLVFEPFFDYQLNPTAQTKVSEPQMEISLSPQSGFPPTISRIRVYLTNIRPADKFQRLLTGDHSRCERLNSTRATLNHIRTVFGDRAIEVASEIKEPRRKLVMRAWKNATGWS